MRAYLYKDGSQSRVTATNIESGQREGYQDFEQHELEFFLGTAAPDMESVVRTGTDLYVDRQTVWQQQPGIGLPSRDVEGANFRRQQVQRALPKRVRRPPARYQ